MHPCVYLRSRRRQPVSMPSTSLDQLLVPGHTICVQLSFPKVSSQHMLNLLVHADANNYIKALRIKIDTESFLI